MAKRNSDVQRPNRHQQVADVLRRIFADASSTPNKSFVVVLSEAQRRALTDTANLSGRLRKKIDECPGGKRSLTLTRRELNELHDGAGTAAVHAPAVHRQRLLALQSQLAKLFAKDLVKSIDREREKGRKAKHPLQTVYQFRINLLDTKPQVWRRIQVPNCSLDGLHRCIQAAMGWNECHIYYFKLGRTRYGDPEMWDDPIIQSSVIDSTSTDIETLCPTDGTAFRITYTYDMGDDWRHEVLFEGCLEPQAKQRYPRCLEGERACPPEDCGGVGGYDLLLEALADSQHPEHVGYRSWVGDAFDPARFDRSQADRRLVKVR